MPSQSMEVLLLKSTYNFCDLPDKFSSSKAVVLFVMPAILLPPLHKGHMF